MPCPAACGRCRVQGRLLMRADGAALSLPPRVAHGADGWVFLQGWGFSNVFFAGLPVHISYMLLPAQLYTMLPQPRPVPSGAKRLLMKAAE